MILDEVDIIENGDLKSSAINSTGLFRLSNIVFIRLFSFIQKNKIPIIFVLANFILSLVVHWPWIKEAPWAWRQAQTLLTTFWFKQEGISLFSYQTPIYGPPWQVPFEFPLYQAFSTIISELLPISIITASHLASLLIFFTSSIFLLLICSEYFSSQFTALIIFFVYLWLPFNFYYSNEILIDYMALTFALGYIYLATKWFARPKRILLALLAILSLSLSSLVKITTVPIIVIPFLLMLIHFIKDQNIRFDNLFVFIKTHKTFLTLLMCMIFIPLLLAILWTYHTDQIKLANPSTAWLTSTRLSSWNFGTISQKLNLHNWWMIIKRIRNYFFSGGTALFLLISLVLAIIYPNKNKFVIFSCIFGTFLTIFIFFNLYDQIQYYIAISAFMSILIGYGLSWSILLVHKQKPALLMILFVLIIGGIVVYPGIIRFKEFREYTDFYHEYNQTAFITIAEEAREITPEDGYIISIQKDWDPELTLWTERKVFIVEPRNSDYFNCEAVSDINYTTVIGTLDSPITKKVLSCFNRYTEVESGLYTVGKSP